MKSLYPSRTKTILADDIINQMKRYFARTSGKLAEDIDEIAEGNVFCVTMEADEREARRCKDRSFGSHVGLGLTRMPASYEAGHEPRPYDDVQFEFNEADFVLGQLNQAVFGKARKDSGFWPNLPFAMFALDFESSRIVKEAPRFLRGHHLHGLIAFHPAYRAQVEKVLPNFVADLKAKHPLMMDQIKIERFDPKRGTLKNWIEYSLKGADMLMRESLWGGELYRLYPNPNGQTYNYPAPKVGSPERKIPYEHERMLQRGARQASTKAAAEAKARFEVR